MCWLLKPGYSYVTFFLIKIVQYNSPPLFTSRAMLPLGPRIWSWLWQNDLALLSQSYNTRAMLVVVVVVFFFIYSKTRKLIECLLHAWPYYVLTPKVNVRPFPTHSGSSLADACQREGWRARVAWRFSPCTRAILISGCSFFHWAPWWWAGRYVKWTMRRVCWLCAKPPGIPGFNVS